MSRSYKKSIVCKDRNNKSCKRLASKTVRRNKNVSDGSKYKRYYCSWNISDYSFHDTFYTAGQFRRNWFDKNCLKFAPLRRRYRTWKEAYRHWLGWYRTK